MLTGIVATDRRGIIGNAGKLPWHLPADLRRFRHLTWRHSVIMGRSTFESLGRWLPERHHLVLTRQPDYSPPWGPLPAGSSFRIITETALPDLARASEEFFVAGGAQIYTLAAPLMKKLQWTLVETDAVGDTRTTIHENFGQEISNEWREADEKNPFDCRFICLIR